MVIQSDVSSSADEDLELSSLSSLSEEEEEEEEIDDDVAINKVAITPRKVREKLNGRPLRRSAAAASEAWLGEVEEKETRDKNVQETPKKRGRPPKSNSLSPTKKNYGVVVIDVPERSQSRSLASTPQKDETSETLKDASRKRGRSLLASTSKFVHSENSPKKRRSIKDSVDGNLASIDRDLEGMSHAGNLGPSMIRPSSSDAYFVNHASRAISSACMRTSDNLISREVAAMAPRTIVSMTKRLAKLSRESKDRLVDGSKAISGILESSLPPTVQFDNFEAYSQHWWSLLRCTSRPMLFYGVGSKRLPLQTFAYSMAQKGKCSVIVIRGEAGGRIEDAVHEMEKVLSISPYTDISRTYRASFSNTFEARVMHLVQTLEEINKTIKDEHSSVPPSFMILLHNIDSPALLQERSLRTLGLLCSSNFIHVCADTMHLNVSFLSGLDVRLQWLWIDLTTYMPILDEIIGETGAGIGRTIGLPSVLDIRRAGADSDVAVLAMDYSKGIQSQLGNDRNTGIANQSAMATSSLTLLSDRAAIHILGSVTYKARGLFLLLGARLLNSTINKENVQRAKSIESLIAIPYDNLAELARSNFLAMTPDALRALLVEFTSHGLISIIDNQVQIALTKSDLQHVIDSFSKQSD